MPDKRTTRRTKKDTAGSQSKRKSTGPRKITLDTQVKITGAHDLKSLLEKFLTRKRVTIDASRTEKIDTSALQLLVAFAIEADKKSIKITWQSPSPALINSARLLGLTELLKLPAESANS